MCIRMTHNFPTYVYVSWLGLPSPHAHPLHIFHLMWGHRTIIIKHHILKHHIPELPNMYVYVSWPPITPW